VPAAFADVTDSRLLADSTTLKAVHDAFVRLGPLVRKAMLGDTGNPF